MSTKPAGAASAPVTLRSPSSLALVAAHIWPMVGVLFLRWNIGEVLLVSWGDVAVLGLFTLVKVAMVDRRWFLLRGPFVLVAIGFILVALLGIVLAIAHEVVKLETGSYAPVDYVAVAWGIAPAVGGFVVSHGLSFWFDFVGRREYAHRSSEDVGKAFFRRALTLLAVAFVAAFVVSAFGNVAWLLVLVIACKLGADLLIHVGEHGTA